MPDASGVDRKIRVGSPASLLAIVPHLLGFVPETSLVVIGTEPSRGRVKLTLRYDLQDPPDPAAVTNIAGHAVEVLGSQRIETAVAIGYGPGRLVTPVADAIRATAPPAGIRVTEILRVEDGRYWSYVCTEPGCCPPEGTPFEPAAHPASAAMSAAGSRVLAARSELAATVGPVTGAEAEAMRNATARAEQRAARLVARVTRSDKRGAARRLIAADGLSTVSEGISSCRMGKALASDEKVAWMTVVLRDLRVRDDAWARMDVGYVDAHLRLWTDVTRRARPGYVAAPASLLAFVAWQSGNGALANVALDRALDDEPGYSMALLLRQVIDSGAPPSMARLPMTPEEVAASYDELDDDNEDDDERNEDNDELDTANEDGDDPADADA